MKLNLNKILILTGAVALVFVISFFFWWNKEFTITVPGIDNEEEPPESSIAGIRCEDYSRRPLAVMMAGDPETRPLSGIADADVVFEMPVAPNGITRFMAVFQCGNPSEIGSIRSAREDFIPLAASLGAIYAHWGGEREALNKLDSGIINNIDAMKYEGSVFYRKTSIPRPHNGFTTIGLLTKKAEELGYDKKDSFAGYPHSEEDVKRNLSNIADSITINYPAPYNVSWQYSEATNTYSRSRGGIPEKDRNSGNLVSAGVVVVMKTSSRVLNKDYIRVNVSGEGEAMIYQNGTVEVGKWRKGAQISDKLYFYGQDEKEIKFLPGKIWIEISIN